MSEERYLEQDINKDLRIFELERQIAEARELLLQIQDHMSQLSTHTHDGWSGSCADIVYEMIEKQLKEKGW
jgi:copper oxidase (laccase) domain-containing protein